jgi:hypothetical protein
MFFDDRQKQKIQSNYVSEMEAEYFSVMSTDQNDGILLETHHHQKNQIQSDLESFRNMVGFTQPKKNIKHIRSLIRLNGLHQHCLKSRRS